MVRRIKLLRGLAQNNNKSQEAWRSSRAELFMAVVDVLELVPHVCFRT